MPTVRANEHYVTRTCLSGCTPRVLAHGWLLEPVNHDRTGTRGYDAAVTAISDPGRPSRRDRRRAQKLIDTAFAEGRLTSADRALRSQRIEAAHSKGDLATITRDLTEPSSARLGSALDSATLSGLRVGTARSAAGKPASTSLPGGMTLDLSKVVGQRVKWIVLAVVLAVVGSCVLGLVGMVASVFQASDSGSSSPTPVTSAEGTATPAVAGLHTVDGWSALLAAIKEQTGTTSVYDAVVYQEYASLGLDGDGAVDRRLYRNGAWQEGWSARTPVHGSLVDLGEIDPEVWAGLPERTAQHFQIANPTGTYVLVNAYTGTPQIMVYVQSEGGSQYRLYGLDGHPLD